MNRLFKVIFVLLIVKPVVLIVLGLNIRHRQKLPLEGPAVLAANHNSHLDTLVLMSLYPLSSIHRVRPIAAADYFLRNKYIAWFSLNCIGIIPLDRNGGNEKNSLFKECHKALDEKDILILFPEGSRGDPDRISDIKKGLFHLVKDRPETRIVPVIMHGLGKALPKGESVFVPFNCDVVVGNPLILGNDSNEFVKNIADSFDGLLNECITRHDSE